MIQDYLKEIFDGWIDKAKLKAFKKRILTVDPEIKALCDKIKEIRKDGGLMEKG